MRTLVLHEKVIVADAVAFVGSENLTSTSLDHNREVGVMGDGDFRDTLLSSLQGDWATAAPFEQQE